MSYFFFSFPVPSASPVNVQARIINTTTIELIWAEPPLDTQNGIIISYRISIAVSETKTNFVINTTTAAALNITDLHPYYGYSLRVSAVTSRGEGPFSDPVSVTTPESGKFASQTEFTILGVGVYSTVYTSSNFRSAEILMKLKILNGTAWMCIQWNFSMWTLLQ